MEAARVRHHVHAGAQVEVVGVAEDDLRAVLLQVTRFERLDGTLGAHRHEDGGLDGTVRRPEDARARARMGVLGVNFEDSGLHEM